VARLLEHGLYYVAVYVARLCFVTVDVDNSQQAFGWVSSYLAHLNEQGRMTTWGTLTIQNEIASAKQRRYSDGETSLSSKAKSSIFFLPGAGLHFLRVSWWRWVVVHKTAGETAGRGGEGQVTNPLFLWRFWWLIGFLIFLMVDFVHRPRRCCGWARWGESPFSGSLWTRRGRIPFYKTASPQWCTSRTAIAPPGKRLLLLLFACVASQLNRR
jgi:hypothetical protein